AAKTGGAEFAPPAKTHPRRVYEGYPAKPRRSAVVRGGALHVGQGAAAEPAKRKKLGRAAQPERLGVRAEPVSRSLIARFHRHEELHWCGVLVAHPCPGQHEIMGQVIEPNWGIDFDGVAAAQEPEHT